MTGFSRGETVAQSAACAGAAEPALRQRALESSSMEDSSRYLSCFPYGDGVVSVRVHHQKLQEAAACERALASDRADELKTFILTFSGSECAPRVAARLGELQSLSSFTNYPNTILVGTALRRGTIEDERACGLGCKSESRSCKGYSYEADRKTCTLWSEIRSRVPRGNTVSGAMAEVRLGMPQLQAPPPQPAPPPAQPAPGMRYLQNADLPGGDYYNLRDVTIEQCNAICTQRGECAGFTYNAAARACFLKNQVNTPMPFAGAISGFKPAAVAPRAAAMPMRLLNNIDLPSSDPSTDYALLPQTSLNACHDRCQNDGQCAAFTYNHRQQACILKNRVNPRMAFPGATSAIK